MNKSPKEKGSNPFVQAHIRSLGVFMIFFSLNLEVKRNIIIRGGREVDSYALMWNILREQVSTVETWKNS